MAAGVPGAAVSAIVETSPCVAGSVIALSKTRLGSGNCGSDGRTRSGLALLTGVGAGSTAGASIMAICNGDSLTENGCRRCIVKTAMTARCTTITMPIEVRRGACDERQVPRPRFLVSHSRCSSIPNIPPDPYQIRVILIISNARLILAWVTCGNCGDPGGSGCCGSNTGSAHCTKIPIFAYKKYAISDKFYVF